MRIVTGRRPIWACASIICSALAILAIIIGVLLITVISSALENFGYIILGLTIMAFPPIVLGFVGIVFSIISFARKERRAVSIVSIVLCAPILIFGIALLVPNVIG